jgi:hypothetical protein
MGLGGVSVCAAVPADRRTRRARGDEGIRPS